MLFAILLILKIFLFINITDIKYNRGIILLISTLITLFFFTLIYLSNHKKKQTIAFSFYNIMSAFMFVDVMYYSFFNSLPSIAMLKQFSEVTAVGDSILALLSFRNLLFLLDIPFLKIYSNKKRKKLAEKNKSYKTYIRWGIPGGIALALILIFSYLAFNDMIEPIARQEIYSYHIKDIKDTIIGEDIVEGRGIFTQEDLEELKERTKLEEGKYTGIGKGKNLLVIQVEALQDFPLNRYYDGQEITPNLNKFIEHESTIYFNNYYQLIGRGNTADAEFVSNNSLYPSMEDPTYKQYYNNTFYGLPWILRDNGYTAWVFHGYKKEFWNRSKAYPNQGFERFISEEDYDLVETIGFGLTDEQFFKQSMDYLKELDSIDDNPFYAFMITLTSHTPFKMPDEYKELNIREEHENTILGDYLQAIHYTDKALGQFFEALKEEGLYEDTVIALYGDHFAITGLNDSGVELMTDFLGYPYDIDEMFKVPLLIHVPGENIKETVSKIGSQLDFLPTILNIMGYQNEKGIMFGKDLLNYEGENYVAPQTYVLKGSFIDDEVIFLMSRDGIFENCIAKDNKTKQKIDVAPFRERYESIIADINKSDYILKNDLIKFLIENEGEMDFDALIESDIPDYEKIGYLNYKPLERLDTLYYVGYRLLAVDIEWYPDKKTILLDDGVDKRPMVEGSIEEYKQVLDQYRDDQNTLEDLINWMKKHEDTYILLRSKELDESIFLKVIEDYPELRDRFIVEMKDFEQYIKLSNKAFKNIILNVADTEYTDEEILDFLNRNNLYGIIIDRKQAKDSLYKKLKKLGINIYIY
ncbi:phosphoglycerol transferase MdoB-like AlkP superfamily enzyme [Keratinibaculum paraultunense]|uniref:Phosphoglycerol transferase MdoB-like AlkP superfamily enzyme n=1 Tax=Keratinibaculum paraultunense TaxID=1278232 RepID=A0A4R3KTY2_9FIRM|nr:sulfatase-like hydrolase/transferase [Keratinibaculum paraultunense]QQY79916.1 sulfatase-like hydrolase/transferase [Keratinibaculum paraultunense]TCS88807.1 phosphoglycerol transferase MdoB-like AlkP superfamily enzyme [Keratinibaculum paraultunense]